MKKIALHGKYGLGKYAYVDDERFHALEEFRWVLGKFSKKFYACRKEWNYSTKRHDIVLMHRVITNAQEGDIVDHKDGDTLNCTLDNLRITDYAGNNRNRSVSERTGRKGVSKCGKNYSATITVNKQLIHLGQYGSELHAKVAYNIAATKYFGDFARLNDIDNWQNIKPERVTKYHNSFRRDNTSGVRGVTWYKRYHKWHASIAFNKHRVSLGYFTDKSDAIEARKQAEQKYIK